LLNVRREEVFKAPIGKYVVLRVIADMEIHYFTELEPDEYFLPMDVDGSYPGLFDQEFNEMFHFIFPFQHAIRARWHIELIAVCVCGE
jgi:hypothetical protein